MEVPNLVTSELLKPVTISINNIYLLTRVVQLVNLLSQYIWSPFCLEVNTHVRRKYLVGG